MLGDALRLGQAVGNVLSNALKFTPAGGGIEVRLGRAGSWIDLRIRDTGEGISADLMPHLFERFRQGEQALGRPHAGLGLGLALARCLVEQHEGTIRAESAGPGQGATLIFALPTIPSGAEVAPPALPPGRGAPVTLAGLRVLVVEDHDDTREFVATVLAHYGAEVTAATSAAAGAGAFERARPDLLVSDIARPGEHGYRLIQGLRARLPEHGRRVPAIALTAHVRAEDRARVLAAGYDRHLAKPIDPIDLVRAVGELAGRL